MKIIPALSLSLVAAAYLACGAEPRVAPTTKTPPSAAPRSVPSAAEEPAGWSPPICGPSAVALHNARDDHEPLPVLHGRNLVAQALTDEGEAVALHLIGIDPKTREGDRATHRAELTLWDRTGAIRWVRRLGPYDPFGERAQYWTEPKLVVTEGNVVVAFDARGPIAVDGGDRMAPVPDEVGGRGVRHLQIAAFSLASGDVAWSRALDATTLDPQTTLRTRDGRLELVHPSAPWLSIEDGGRGEPQTMDVGPDHLATQLAEGIGQGPDGELWSIERRARVSGDERALGAPALLVAPTSRPGELHVCVVPCGEDAIECGERGRCSEEDGLCVVTEETCRASKDCLADGACAPLDRLRCGALHDDHCKPSRACRERGACFAENQSCYRRCPDGSLASECFDETTTCEGSLECRDHGACALEHGRCVVGTDADCRGSRLCKEHGACASIEPIAGRSCHAPSAAACRQSAACRDDGRCTLFRDDFGHGVCRVHTAADCRGSRGCREDAACTPIAGGPFEGLHCRPGSSDDCRRSALCRREGRCRMVNGECVP